MDFEDAISRLQAAQNDPEKLTLATVDIVLATHEPVLRTALEAAAVPHGFDAGILSTLLETDEATASKWVEELRQLPMVEAFPARSAWNVHEASRLALRHRLASEEVSRLHALSALATKCFENDGPASRVETIYHRLLAAPEQAADELERLWKEWDGAGRYEPLQALGVALGELILADQLPPPARARSLVCFGWIRRGMLPLRKAEELSREALELFHNLGYEPGEADARDQLGDILRAEGNLAGALREYEAFKQIMERLTQRDPDNTDWQRELSVSHNLIGGVYEAQGRLADALREYEADLAIAERLAAHDPTNAQWQKDLATTQMSVDWLRKQLGPQP